MSTTGSDGTPRGHGARYVPRPTTERALEELARALSVDRSHVILAGGHGMGKTLLLRVLCERLASSLQCVYVGQPTLPEDEIAGWILGLMGAAGSDDPAARLAREARALGDRGSGLVVVVDDAGSMPPETLRRLGRIAAAARPHLRLALALSRDDEDEAEGDDPVAVIVSLLGSGAEKVVLDSAMGPSETVALARAELRWSGAGPELMAAFTDRVGEAIHRRTRGVPLLVTSEAHAWLRDAERHGTDQADAAATREATPTEPDGGPVLAQEPEAEVEAEHQARVPASTRRTPASTSPAIEQRLSRMRRTALAAALAAGGLLAVGVAWLALHPRAATVQTPPREAAEPRVVRLPAHAESPAAPTPPTPKPVVPTPAAPEAAASGAEPPPEATERSPAGSESAASSEPVETATAPPPPEPDPPPTPEPVESAESVEPAEPLESLEPLESAAAPGPPPEPPAGLATDWTPPEGAAADPSAEASLPAAPAAAPAIRVHFNARPWARIEVDGDTIGVTPLGDIPLSAGTHEIAAHLPDGRVIEREVEVDDYRNRFVFP